ncbi:hypothetical protein ACJMK2_025681 [Sinanodonta woodiana]|uniref:Uncharacterized protein n=1 Tax=Sinanodonta woodiana TaxID=1069815 RepID=A0ABD3XJ46_SINWO
MSLIYLVFCCLAIHIVTEGKLIQGILGQSVSFSWSYNVTFYDSVLILHNESVCCVILPDFTNSCSLKETDRFRVLADNTTPDKVKLTVHFLNFSTNDIGLYRVTRQRNARELDVSVHLETYGVHHYTSMVTVQDETSQGINRHSTAASIPDTDIEALPSKRQLLNIVLGMGGIIAVAFIACLLHKIRIGVRVYKVSSCNTLSNSSKDEVDDSLREENFPENYWTIVSNERGEMSTAIETDFERHMETSLIVHATISAQNESEDLLRGYTIRLNDKIDENLSPIQSRPVEFDEYIHPVHSEPVEFDEYIHPVHSEPVEFDGYIHPIHTDPVEVGSYNLPLHTDFVNKVYVSDNE